jgi:hypothetical protein
MSQEENHHVVARTELTTLLLISGSLDGVGKLPCGGGPESPPGPVAWQQSDDQQHGLSHQV